jgi:hypothetical protein
LAHCRDRGAFDKFLLMAIDSGVIAKSRRYPGRMIMLERLLGLNHSRPQPHRLRTIWLKPLDGQRLSGANMRWCSSNLREADAIAFGFRHEAAVDEVERQQQRTAREMNRVDVVLTELRERHAQLGAAQAKAACEPQINRLQAAASLVQSAQAEFGDDPGKINIPLLTFGGLHRRASSNGGAAFIKFLSRSWF